MVPQFLICKTQKFELIYDESKFTCPLSSIGKISLPAGKCALNQTKLQRKLNSYFTKQFINLFKR